ncbi:MAG: diguanylate cyclase, partial [Bacillota bacterium]
FYAKVNGIMIGENKFLGFVEDIDRRVKMENRLKKQKAYFEQLFNESTEGIVLLNNKGTVLKVNNFFLNIFGYNRDEVLGENIDELITPEDKRDEGVYYTEEVMDGKDIIEESIRKTKSGKTINVSIHAFPIKLDEGQIGIYGIYNDITERKKQEEKRRFLSFHDQLTELYNRRYFENEMERLDNSRKTPISIIVGDLDGLKDVNDNYGHRAGDEYIKHTADIIKDVTRSEDIVARIGGDEYAVLLPQTNEKDVCKVIERISSQIDFYNKESENPIGISIGYAVKKSKDENLEEVFKRADAMMYRQKRKHKRSS